MSIPSANTQHPIVAPIFKMPWVDKDGMLTANAKQFIQQTYAFIVNMTRVIPVNCTNSGNVYTLTQLTPSPLVTQYNDYDCYTFVASAGSTGAVTGGVTTSKGTALVAVQWFKSNGAAQASSGDIVSGSLYLAIFNDALNGGAGGFVIK